MAACVLDATGASPSLRDEVRPLPSPGPDQVLVRVAAAAFCYHDALVMSGVLRRGVRLPLIPGHEVAGVMEAVGEGVGDGWVGTHVTVLPGAVGHRLDGGFAGYLLAPWEEVMALPGDISPVHAALLGCPIGVALKAVQDVGAVRAGETVLVTGVSGGLGVHAAQVAHAAGATVFGVTGSAAKAERLEVMPWLEAVLVEGEVAWDEAARAVTGDHGIDVVIDTVGVQIAQAVRALAQGGRLVLLGQVSGAPASLSAAEVVFREAHIAGSRGVSQRQAERALALVREGTIRPMVDRVLPMRAASVLEAHHLVRGREVTGRVVLEVEG